MPSRAFGNLRNYVVLPIFEVRNYVELQIFEVYTKQFRVAEKKRKRKTPQKAKTFGPYHKFVSG